MAALTESRSIGVSRRPDTLVAMPHPVDTLGICATCGYVDICTSRATWQGPVFHCEEFDDQVQLQGTRAPRQRVGTTQLASAVPVERVGLCINCAHENTCGLRRAEGGVWHCEEYE